MDNGQNTNSTNQEAIPVSWRERELQFADEGSGELSRVPNVPTTDETGQKHVGLRNKITHHSDFLGRNVYGSVDKVYWGTFEGNPACLLVVRFNLTHEPGFARLQKFDTSITFRNSLVNRHNTQQPNSRKAPKVVRYSPACMYGFPTEVNRVYTWGVVLQCSASAGPFDFGPELSFGGERRFRTEDALEITGLSEPEDGVDEPNKVMFSVLGNGSAGYGVPHQLHFGVIIEHCDTEALEAVVWTSILDRWAWPWSKDDPLVIHQNAERCVVSSTTIPRNFEALTDDHWKKLVPYVGERVNVVQGQ